MRRAGKREGEESGEQRTGGDSSLTPGRGAAACEHQLQDFIAWRRRCPGLTVLPAFRIGKRASAQEKRRRPTARDPLPGVACEPRVLLDPLPVGVQRVASALR